MSVPSLKMTFMHHYNAPRVLHSTTDYGRKSHFEEFGALLDIDWGCRSIVHSGESSDILPFLLCHCYTGCSPCDIGILGIHRSLAILGTWKLLNSGYFSYLAIPQSLEDIVFLAHISC